MNQNHHHQMIFLGKLIIEKETSPNRENVKWEPPSLSLSEGILLHLKAHPEINNNGNVPRAVKEAFELLGFCEDVKGQWHVYRSSKVLFPKDLRDIDIISTSTPDENIRVTPPEIYNLVEVTSRREIEEEDDEDDRSNSATISTGDTAEEIPQAGTRVLKVADIMKMPKSQCISELQNRGMPQMAKESLQRLRTILIENFSNTAPPQVEVVADTIPIATTTVTPVTTNTVIGTQDETTNTSADTTINNNDNNIDLTADLDTWCLCGLPNDGRTYVQCSREERCRAARDGWFHTDCLKSAGWSKPKRGQNNWLCQSCDVFENGV
jgi:hypothetical protein